MILSNAFTNPKRQVFSRREMNQSWSETSLYWIAEHVFWLISSDKTIVVPRWHTMSEFVMASLIFKRLKKKCYRSLVFLKVNSVYESTNMYRYALPNN